MKRFTAFVLFFSVLLAGFVINVDPTDASSSGDIPFISIEELKDKLGVPSVVILDVRIPKHIAASRFKVKGAVWVNPKEIDSGFIYFPGIQPMCCTETDPQRRRVPGWHRK